jgi:hypothetical protein
MSPDRITAAMIALCLLAPIARAEGDTPKPPIQTLAQALAQAAPPKSDLYIAVDADLIPPPKDAAPAELGDTASRIATVYGRKIGGFGDVDAIAPPTVMVIDIPPETPNIYDGMPPKQIMKLLAATYSADQWKAFLSEDGVGYESLTRDDQKRLFEALFPEGKLEIIRSDAAMPDAPRTTIAADQLRKSRLRLAYKTGIALPDPASPGSEVFANDYQPPDKPTPYYMMNSPSIAVDREFGATVRETVPNTLKPSDLSDDDPAWGVQISMDPIKTVDDAARVISAATHRDVYADPRYGGKSVTMRGPRTAHRTYDVMRALALCVGGACRSGDGGKVGFGALPLMSVLFYFRGV